MEKKKGIVIIIIITLITYSFAKLMFDGKTKPTLDLLPGVCRGRRFSLNEIADVAEGTTVYEDLRTKHPPAAPIHHECLIADCAPTPAHHPVIFVALCCIADFWCCWAFRC